MLRFVCAVFFLLLVSLPTRAAEIELEDGTVVIGTILALTDGEDLRIDTEHMDEVTVDWSAVISLKNTDPLDVVLFDGQRKRGPIVVDKQTVSVLNVIPFDIQREAVFEMSEVNETAREAFSAYTDVGTNIVRGNNRVTQASFAGGVAYDTSVFRTSLNATSLLNEQELGGDTRRLTLDANYAYKFSSHLQAFAFYQFESDEQQSLDGRSLYGGGLGHRLVNQRRHRLEVFGGLALNSEEFSDTPRNESLEGVLGTRYRLRWFIDSDLRLIVLPSLQESDRIRTQLDASVNFDLYADLDFKITFYDRYDSQPPPENKKNDSGITFGLSWKY